ncbi:NADPH--cytochrome P450 reductase [Schistosoma japonicum]|nr:NADPH--cytochrome P450 reductase [Schistosoma japonicum]KAH8871739.1 NADPH--cytochrome P450 reductase [Schistosoma japonicum]
MDTFGLHFTVLVIIALYISCRRLKLILYKLLHEGHRVGVCNELEGSSHDDILSVINRSSIKVSIFYGSQTGTAKKFAIDLGHHLHDCGIRNLVIDLRYLSMDILVNLSMLDTCVALFVVATYGEGEPTDNSRSFMDDVENSFQNLNKLHFAVFGMGNSMYTYFNAFGKSVDRLLSKHGAKRLRPLTLGDEVNELESTFINWKNLVTSALIDFFNLSNSNKNYFDKQYKRMYSLKYINWSLPLVSYYTNMLINKAHVKEMLPYGTDNYFYVPVIANEELNHESSRSCRYIELDLSTSQLRYKTGDHVAIFPPNPTYLVETIGVLLKINLNEMISLDATDTYSFVKHPFPCPCTYRHAFMYFVDITGPPGRSLFSACSSFIGNPKELHNRKLYSKWILEDHRGLIDVLHDLKSFRPPADLLLELLNPLKPRLYSISSSSLVHPNRLHITAAVVRYETSSGRIFKGLATNWLKSLDSSRNQQHLNMKIPITIHTSKFYLPRSRVIPIIMIASGTGIAPFRAFIQERLKMAYDKAGKNGQMVLFFGCRHENEDFIYSDELKQACATGLLQMFTAFSRDSSDGNKVYVQHKLLEMGSMVWELLDELYAYIYVCGNAAGMARDVHSCLIDLVVKHSKVTTEVATSYMLNLRRQGRYRTDVWK